MSSFKLDPEEKKQWLEDLRSGEYKQCTAQLIKSVKIYGVEETRYCCLGVWKREHLNINGYIAVTQNPYLESVMPIDVSERLIRMNDYEKLTFPQIADWIEENL